METPTLIQAMDDYTLGITVGRPTISISCDGIDDAEEWEVIQIRLDLNYYPVEISDALQFLVYEVNDPDDISGIVLCHDDQGIPLEEALEMLEGKDEFRPEETFSFFIKIERAQLISRLIDALGETDNDLHATLMEKVTEVCRPDTVH